LLELLHPFEVHSKVQTNNLQSKNEVSEKLDQQEPGIPDCRHEHREKVDSDEKNDFTNHEESVKVSVLRLLDDVGKQE
jgi:hypothetical protein